MAKRFGYETAAKIDYEILKQNARSLRNYPTEAEKQLWEYLRKNKLGIRFRRQHILYDYIADFGCLKAKLVVELDGGDHFTTQQQISDMKRTSNIESRGYKVIRFENYEIEENPSRVADKIFDETVSRLHQIS